METRTFYGDECSVTIDGERLALRESDTVRVTPSKIRFTAKVSGDGREVVRVKQPPTIGSIEFDVARSSGANGVLNQALVRARTKMGFMRIDLSDASGRMLGSWGGMIDGTPGGRGDRYTWSVSVQGLVLEE